MRMGERKMKDWTVKTETEKEKVENPLYNGGGEEKREKKKSKKKKKKKIEKVIRTPSKSFIRNPGNLIRRENRNKGLNAAGFDGRVEVNT